MKLNLKTLFLIFCLTAALSLSVAGCSKREDEAANPTPTPTANFMPEDNGTQSSAQTAAFDWTQNAADIEARIDQISEISESRVVVSGNTALVAVKFASEYRGEITERIREMVAAEIMAVDPNIETVAVTADEDDVNSVFDIAEALLSGTKAEELKNDITQIVRNATTLR